MLVVSLLLNALESNCSVISLQMNGIELLNMQKTDKKILVLFAYIKKML